MNQEDAAPYDPNSALQTTTGQERHRPLIISEPTSPQEQSATAVVETVMTGQKSRQETLGSSVRSPHANGQNVNHTIGQNVDRSIGRITKREGDRIAPPIVHSVVADRGTTLDSPTQNVCESILGRSFASVRIHTDVRADRAARSMGASAFTVDNHIAFKRGAFDPQTDEGMAILLEELVHVHQQERLDTPRVDCVFGPLKRLFTSGSEISASELELDTGAESIETQFKQFKRSKPDSGQKDYLDNWNGILKKDPSQTADEIEVLIMSMRPKKEWFQAYYPLISFINHHAKDVSDQPTTDDDDDAGDVITIDKRSLTVLFSEQPNKKYATKTAYQYIFLFTDPDPLSIFLERNPSEKWVEKNYKWIPLARVDEIQQEIPKGNR